jgi:hypothetical protein
MGQVGPTLPFRPTFQTISVDLSCLFPIMNNACAWLLIILETTNVEMSELEKHTRSEAAPIESEAAQAEKRTHAPPPHGGKSSQVQQTIPPFPSDLEVSSSVDVSHRRVAKQSPPNQLLGQFRDRFCHWIFCGVRTPVWLFYHTHSDTAQEFYYLTQV